MTAWAVLTRRIVLASAHAHQVAGTQLRTKFHMHPVEIVVAGGAVSVFTAIAWLRRRCSATGAADDGDMPAMAPIVEPWDGNGDHWEAAHALDRKRSREEPTKRPERFTTRFILVRHAETEVNLQPHLIGGRSHFTQLSSRGRRQAAALGRRLARELVSEEKESRGGQRCCALWKVVTSTAPRAVETARIAISEVCSVTGLEVKQLPSPSATDCLHELSQGAWEGKDRGEVYTPTALSTINSNNWLVRGPGVSPPEFGSAEGESPRTVELRALGFLEELLSTPSTLGAGNERVVLIVAHGMTIKNVLRGILGWNPKMTHKVCIDNTGISEVVYDATTGDAGRGRGGWHVTRVNDHAHTGEFSE